jgi:diamine N-acetyltransferase
MPIRAATPDDAPLLRSLILALADYEKLRDEAEAGCSEGHLRAHLRPGADPSLGTLIAETDTGEAAGFALFFPVYSTFHTNWGLHLEDLFVRPEQRGAGFGLALMRAVAAEAVRRGCVRMEWAVLDWNAPAIGFYERLGARPMSDWTTMRLTGDALAALAAS